MLFWVAVIAGAGFSYMGLKKGFFPMWAIFFNILISVYLCVMLLPVIASTVPDSGGQTYYYSCAACMLIVGVLVFVVLQMIASNYFSGGFEVTFPKLFNSIGAAVLGFMSGYLVCCMLIVIVSLMPFSNYSLVEDVLSPTNLPDAVEKPMVSVCDFIGRVSIQVYPKVAAETIEEFISDRDRRLRNRNVPEETEGYREF